MKRILTITITTILSLLSISSTLAQNTEGTDFWLTFGQNGNSVLYTTVNLQIRIVAKEHQTTGRIYFNSLGTYEDFVIEAKQVYTRPLEDFEKQAVYNTVMGVSDRSIRITSDLPVTVYAMTQRGASADATNILPVTALGTEYYQISYFTFDAIFDGYGVVATEDNTEVFHNNLSIGTLNEGDVYYRIGAGNEGMIGDFITSHKPIAFFSLMRSFGINPLSAADCGMQQLASVNTWGKNFFVPVSHIVQDIVQIVASQDGTDITQIGGIIQTVPGGQTTLTNLQAGQFVELAVPLSNDGCYIQSNKPVGICNYLWGGLNYGDAAICWLPPIEQSVKSALVAPFIPSGTTEIHSHYVTLFTPTATRDNTQVSIGNDAPTGLSGVTWLEHDLAGMSFCKMQLANDTAAYYFTNPAGFLVFCFGIGNAESYYYPAYSAMRDLDVAFYINDVHFQDLQDTTFCSKDVNFRAEIDGNGIDIETIKWYINGTEELSAQNLQTWSKPFENGIYEITMEVHFENDEIKTITNALKIQALWLKMRNIRH